MIRSSWLALAPSVLLVVACSSTSSPGTSPSDASVVSDGCTIGPGPTLVAVAPLGPDVAKYGGSVLHFCRNATCTSLLFAPETLTFASGAGVGFAPSTTFDASDSVSAIVWNEGGDGYVLDVEDRAAGAVADGDTYTVTLSFADGGTSAVALAGTATYEHVPNCAGGYPSFRLGLSCPETSETTPCPSGWDPIECKCIDVPTDASAEGGSDAEPTD